MDSQQVIRKPLDADYDPKSTLRILMSPLEFNLAGGDDIEQPPQDPASCAICKGVAVSPMLAHCKVQLICARCSQGCDVCPLCEKPDCLSKELGMFEYFIKPFIGLCPYYSEGCDETFSLLDLVKHLDTCPHTVYICGCKGKMKRTRIHDHYRMECPLRVQSCSYCDGNFHQEDMQQHIDNSHPQCAHCYEHHRQDDETHVPQPCPVDACERYIPLCSLKEHLRIEHEDFLFEETKRLQEENQQLETANKEQLEKHSRELLAKDEEICLLQEANDKLSATIEQKDETITSLRSQFTCPRCEQTMRSDHAEQHILKLCPNSEMQCPICNDKMLRHQLQDHTLECERQHNLIKFHPERHGVRVRVVEDGAAAELHIQGATTATSAYSGCQSGVTRWVIRSDHCLRSSVVGVVAVDCIESLDNWVGSRATGGVGLWATGEMYIHGGMVHSSPMLSFSSGSSVYVTLDMDARTVTFNIGGDGYSHTEELLHEGAHVIAVSFSRTHEKCSIVSCESL